MTKTSDISPDPDLTLYINAVMGKKAKDPVVLDVRELTSVSDIFIICSGRSNRQVSAIAEHIQVNLKKHAIKPLNVEGKKEGHWVLLDYGHVIIHIFYEPVRSFYDLEGLWIDAKRIDAKRFFTGPATS
jgi:ribosome-associated protein